MKPTERQAHLLSYMNQRSDIDSFMAMQALRRFFARPSTTDALRIMGQLCDKGLAERLSRGNYRITREGREYLQRLHP